MNDKPGVGEQYGRATQSSDLRHRQRVVADPDRLAAMAWSDRRLATSVYRAKVANDPFAVRELREKWRQECMKMADRRRWTVVLPAQRVGNAKQVLVEVAIPTLLVYEVARLSIQHWLFDVCPDCIGRKYRLQVDVLTEMGAITPEQAAAIGRDVLSDDLCKSCGGTGKPAYDAPEYLLPLVKAAVESLETRYREAGGNAIRRLRMDVG